MFDLLFFLKKTKKHVCVFQGPRGEKGYPGEVGEPGEPFLVEGAPEKVEAGDPGEEGPEGRAGPMGDRGPEGEEGDEGVTGVQGPKVGPRPRISLALFNRVREDAKAQWATSVHLERKVNAVNPVIRWIVLLVNPVNLVTMGPPG